MFNSSPIEVWEGAGVFYSFGAGTGMTVLIFWLAVICCLIPLWVSLQTENHHEHKHQSGGADDTDHTHGVER